MSIRTGTAVTWRWGGSWAQGTVAEVHHAKVTRSTKGEQVTRNGSDDDPAYVIEQEDGTTVLKLSSDRARLTPARTSWAAVARTTASPDVLDERRSGTDTLDLDG